MRTKANKYIIDIVKAAKKHSRLEEISQHGKSINYTKVATSKKLYNRKKVE